MGTCANILNSSVMLYFIRFMGNHARNVNTSIHYLGDAVAIGKKDTICLKYILMDGCNMSRFDKKHM